MAKIPNQNSINDTIKAQINALDSVLNTVINSADAISKNASATLKNLSVYSSIIHTVFDGGGVFSLITQNMPNLEALAKVKVNTKTLSNVKQKILYVYRELNSLAIELNTMQAAPMPKLELGGFNKIVKSITDIMKIADENSMFGIRIKFFKMRRTIKQIVKGINSINVSIDVNRFKEAQKGFDAFFKIVDGLLTLIKKSSILPIFLIKLKNIRRIIGKAEIICNDIAAIPEKNLKDTGKNSKLLETIFKSLSDMFKSIHKIWAGPLLRATLKNISRSILLINDVVNKVGNLRVNKKALTKITTLTLIFGALALFFTAITVMTPIWLVGVVAALILLGIMKVFSFVVRFIVNTIVNLAKGPALKGMLALLLISGLFTAIAVMFMFLGTIAKDIVKQSLWILAMLGVIIVFVGLMAALGLACAAAALPLLAATAGILLITIIAGLLVLLALMLKELEKINLDGDKIKENVDIVIGVATDIIAGIFKSDDTEDKESDKSWIEDILTFVGGAIGPVIKAIMAVAFLALMTVGIAMILLIAGMLRLIQELDLDASKIKANTRIVIDTAMLVVDSIFNHSDSNSKESNKSWIATVLENFGGTLFTIIKAILAVAFLATILVAITLILLLAAQLRLLQELALDPNKIRQNVGIVIDTAQMVVSSIFDPQDKETTPSNRSWIVTVISWFSPELATIIEAIMAIAFLATMIVVILLINILALELKTLQEIMLDPALISQNVTTVIDTCQFVVSSIMDRKDKDDDPSSKGWIRKLFEWIGADGLIQIIDCIMALAWLGMTVALINMVTMLANQLKTLQDIQLDKGRITKNTEAVCKTADAVSQCVLGRKNPIKGSSDGPLGKVLRWLFPALAEAIDMMTKMKWVSGIMSTVGVVKQVADVLLTLNDLPDLSGVKSKTERVCNTADSIVALVTSRPGVPTNISESRISWMERINKTIKEMQYIRPDALNKSRRALSAHIALIKQINTVDVTKLETSARMFQQMARFSESIHGNFSKLAKTLNEDLMPVLEELKEIMGIIPEKLDTGFQNTSASIAAQNAPQTESNIFAQVSREKPNMDKAQVDQLVQQRLKEYSNNSSKGVAAKLDELINLLKGYSGEHVQVQTV